MEKVRLTLDELQVQSFATTEQGAGRRGTVHGHDAPSDAVECPTADPAYGTCWASCNGCSNSCDCETGNCTVEEECWFTDWGPCTWGSRGGPSDC